MMRNIKLCLVILLFTMLNLTANIAVGQYDVYHANLHVHTTYSAQPGDKYYDHFFTQDPIKTVQTAKNIGLQVLGLSDHGESITESDQLHEWTNLGTLADDNKGPGGCVVLRGFEWSSNTYNHINIFGTSEYTGTRQWLGGNPDPLALQLSDIYRWLEDHADENPVVQFNHIFTGNQFSGFINRTPTLDRLFCLAEVGGGDLAYESPSSTESLYKEALLQGWHVAPGIGVDDQLPLDGGTPDDPSDDFAAIQHTGIWAPSNADRNAIMDSLRARRVFASEDRDFQLKFLASTDGGNVWHWMGESLTIQPGDSVMFKIDAIDPTAGSPEKEWFDSMDILTPIQNTPVISFGSHNDTSWTLQTEMDCNRLDSLKIPSTGESCLYVRIRQKGEEDLEKDSIYSAPVWIKLASTPATVRISTPTDFIQRGWNLISLPAVPVVGNPESVLSGIDMTNASLQLWDNSKDNGGGYLIYNQNWFGPMKPGDTYWFIESASKTINYLSYPNSPEAKTITIPAHTKFPCWVMVGLPCDKTIPCTEIKFSIDGTNFVSWENAVQDSDKHWIEAAAQGFNPTTQGYFNASCVGSYQKDYLEPWFGYWILVKTDKELTISFPVQ